MIEEMRHGWQMCALLIDFFGSSGKSSAEDAGAPRLENQRLLGTFTSISTTGWTSSPTPDFVTAMEIPVTDA